MGTLTIADQAVTVTQDGVPCLYSVSPTTVSAQPGGDTVTFTVSRTQGGGCSWTAVSNTAWLAVLSGASGSTDSGTVTVSVAANGYNARDGSLTIAGNTVKVTQPAVSCAHTVTPTNASVPASGGTVTFTLSIPQGPTCVWHVTTNANWLTNTSPGPPTSAGTGPAAVTFSVAPNTGAARFGTMSIAGDQVSVTQDGDAPASCAYTVSPTTASIPAGGGGVTLTVTNTQGSNCTWTAGSNNGFLLITNGQGTGSGTITVSALANADAARSGSVTIAGQTVTITQDSNCSFSVSPTSTSIPTSGGNAPITVLVGAGCSWTSSSNATFLTFSGVASGTGNGSVLVSASGNDTSTSRSGTVAVAGQTITVTQPAVACAFTVSPTVATVAASGGGTQFAVTNQQGSGCSWTAVSNAGFLSVTGGGSGTGPGDVSVSAAANTEAARSGTLTITGQTVTVNQDAAGSTACAYTVSPTTQNMSSDGGSTFLTVTNAQGTDCTFTAVSNTGFLTVSAVTSTSVTVAVAANTGVARSGTLTIADQAVTVTQDGVPCLYSVSPTTVSAQPGGDTVTFTVSRTQGGGCSWTAVSNTAWLAVLSGASGSTDSGTVTVSVAANGYNARDGSLTIAGNTVKVTQPAISCAHTVTPTNASVPASGGTVTFTLSIPQGPTCVWHVTISGGWLTNTSPGPPTFAGTGSATVTFSVAPNTGAARVRSGSIAGDGITVTQAGS